METPRVVRYYWLKLLRLQDSPERIALGIAIGVFINFTPFLGFHTIMALLAFFVFPINRFATIVTVWVNTPWTVPFFLALDYQLGSWLLGIKVDWQAFNFDNLSSLMALGQEVFLTLMTGGMLLGIVCAIAIYYPSLYLIRLYRHRRRELMFSP